MKQRCDADRWSPEGERRSPSEDEADEKVSAAEIYNAEDYKEIFQPKNAICRCNDTVAPGAGLRSSPSLTRFLPTARTPPRMSEPFPAPPDDGEAIGAHERLHSTVQIILSCD